MIDLIKIKKAMLVGCMLLTASWIMAGDFANSRFNQRIVSLNPGYIFSGNGDCWGISNEITHFKSFSPRLFHMERIQGWIVNGNSWIDGGFENQTGVNIAAEIGITPFKTGNRIFYLAAGGVLGYMSNISPGFGTHYSYEYQGNIQSLNRIGYSAENYFTPGYSLSAGYITKVNSTLYLNIRAHIDAYNSGDVVSTLSIGIGLNASPKH
ncbi:MAG: hypothetical protein Q7J05_06760 [Paludibacter sp.]|nr:hypothetical protein [Paludibacter sp.]